MDAETWAAIAAAVVATVALYFAAVSARAAKKAAIHAEAVASVEQERRDEERERRHEELEPPRPSKIETEVFGTTLYGRLPALPRDYLIRIGLCDEGQPGGKFRFQPQWHVSAHVPYCFPIDVWPLKPSVQFVVAVKFWCPDLDDDHTGPSPWTCKCGGPGLGSYYVLDADEQLSGDGHWEWWAVPIDLPFDEKAPAD
ncbi:hypothetical protein ACIHFD_66575 [Nonomuraea sp. NPDC051941]|uniref:hypothetical protein n=1 Tax=Nonomuraea sp. NPDC051941 TaxID=3364373 RepID=UPI0037CBC445